MSDNKQQNYQAVKGVESQTPCYINTKWTNNGYTIEWANEDEVKIIDHALGRSRIIAGGDLETLLSCLFI